MKEEIDHQDARGIRERYINLHQAAAYLGLSHQTVYKWAEGGKMPAYKLGRVWRFDPQELDGFVHEFGASPSEFCYNCSRPSRSAVGFGRKGG